MGSSETIPEAQKIGIICWDIIFGDIIIGKTECNGRTRIYKHVW